MLSDRSIAQAYRIAFNMRYARAARNSDADILRWHYRLRLAAEIDATTPEPWLYLGLNSYALGDNQSAESSLRKAILLTRDDESRAAYQVRRAYITLGRILIASGRAEEGRKFLDKGRELQNKVLELSQLQIGAHLLEGGAGAAAVVQPLAEKSPVLTDSGPVDLFASSHTCLPVFQGFEERPRNGAALIAPLVLNNGAAGMPNLAGAREGLLTRIATRPFERQQRRFGLQHGALHLDAIAIDYDDAAWQRSFLAQWPDGSDAHASYWPRISAGTDYTIDDALRVERTFIEAC
jgi:tetratricopeptide (TPR) repeat protein